MWISKKRFDRLIERLEAAEKAATNHPRPTLAVDKYPGQQSGLWGWTTRYYELDLASAVRQLADHVGVEFKFQRGTPDTVTLEKRKK